MLLTGTSIALILAAQTATGQAAPGRTAGSGDDRAALPEIIVTARRLPESIQRVPVSVTAFDDAAISRLGATSLDELARFTPGFSFNSAAGRGW